MATWQTYARIRREPSLARVLLVILLVLWGIVGPALFGRSFISGPVNAGSVLGLGLVSVTFGVGWLGGVLVLGFLALLVPVHYRIEEPAGGDVRLERGEPRM